MLTEISEAEWAQALELEPLPVFFQPDYLSAVANSFKVSIKYYVLKKKGKLAVAIAVFVKGRSIVLPENFTYSPLWVSDAMDERDRLEVLKQLLTSLKASFYRIALRFSVEVTDVRPFIWQGFQVENRYTYIKTPGLQAHYSIEKNLKHKNVESYNCIAQVPDATSVRVNIRFLRSLGYSAKKTKAFMSLFTALAERGYLRAFSLYRADICLGSNLVLLDKKLLKAYMLALNPISRSEKYAHTFLYQYMIETLFSQGHKEIDFCGANMEGIANFKSYFNPQLRPYFIIRYSAVRNRFKRVFQLIDRI
ncbi:MAG: hypothetical protein K0S09_195 [Sphingobacteriaceae bacterium]|jgi:hypothetical protein|nr:hypothetical protein [Sphingobacteriaceae bacterium]